MILIQSLLRGNDSWGAGHFGAPRGSKTHRGIDIACIKGSGVLSFFDGVVTKIGFPYSQKKPSVHQSEQFLKKKALRYVEVQRIDGLYFRYFYIKPSVKKGDVIKKGDIIGITQGLVNIYPGITDHMHVEIKDHNGKYIDPNLFIDKV